MNPNLIVTKKWHFKFFSTRKTTRENLKIWINSTYILTIIFIAILWIYYVWSLNVNATQWYNIRNAELEKNRLLLEKELLDVQIAELQSLNNLLNWEWINIMQKSQNQEFFVIKDPQIYAFKY